MSFTFRNRTKGKGSWLNFSASKKRGFGVSASTKLSKNVTANYGRDGLKTTVNLGNGVRYTWKPSKSDNTSKVSEFFDVSDETVEHFDTEGPHWAIKALLFIVLMAVFMGLLLFLGIHIHANK